MVPAVFVQVVCFAGHFPVVFTASVQIVSERSFLCSDKSVIQDIRIDSGSSVVMVRSLNVMILGWMVGG